MRRLLELSHHLSPVRRSTPSPVSIVTLARLMVLPLPVLLSPLCSHLRNRSRSPRKTVLRLATRSPRQPEPARLRVRRGLAVVRPSLRRSPCSHVRIRCRSDPCLTTRFPQHPELAWLLVQRRLLGRPHSRGPHRLSPHAVRKGATAIGPSLVTSHRRSRRRRLNAAAVQRRVQAIRSSTAVTNQRRCQRRLHENGVDGKEAEM